MKDLFINWIMDISTGQSLPIMGGIDVWIGIELGKQLNAVMCTVDLVKNDAELKLLIGCTQKEKAYINSFYNDWPQIGGILIEVMIRKSYDLSK